MKLPAWNDFTELEPAWYAAAAAVAGAGVALFPGNRILAGLVGGATVLVIGAMRRGGCGCGGTVARAPAVAGDTPAPPMQSAPPLDFGSFVEGAQNVRFIAPSTPRGCS